MHYVATAGPSLVDQRDWRIAVYATVSLQLQGRKERRRVEPESDIICGRDSLFWSEENNSTLEGNAGQSRPTWGKLEHAGRTPAAEQGGSQWRGRIVGVASGVANQIVGVVNKKEKLNQWKQQAANFLANCVQDKNTGTKMFLHTSLSQYIVFFTANI